MKISIDCKDAILERALELFLREHLVAKKDCDFIICDEKIPSLKPLFIINDNSPFLQVPFSGEKLFDSLREFDGALRITAEKLAQEQKKILEQKIDMIASEFKKEYEEKIDRAILSLKERLIKALVNERD